MSICVIFNPAAGGGKAKQLRQLLDSTAGKCALKPTSAPGAGRRLAAEAVREGHDLIVAAGGDGTLNEVLNGIGDMPDGFARAALAILPVGTLNVCARELGIPTNLQQAWKVIQQGRQTRLDLPQVDFAIDGEERRQYFVQLAGAGLDARAIEQVDLNLKKKIGPLAYVVAGLKAMQGPQPIITVTWGSESAQGELVLLGNGRFYGGQFILFPKADLRDGLLDVCVFSRVRWSDLVLRGWGLLRQKLFAQSGVKYFQTPSLTLTSPTCVPFQAEGDNCGHLPATVSIRCLGLRVVVP